jgi:hypothetical protein
VLARDGYRCTATRAAEATRAPGDPLLVRTRYGRTWRFGALDVRPARLRRYAALAESLGSRRPEEIGAAEAIELSAVAEEMIRSALPAADRDAFDNAPFTGTEIAELCEAYFAALGVDAGESAASPASSEITGTRSRPTSRRRGRR